MSSATRVVNRLMFALAESISEFLGGRLCRTFSANFFSSKDGGDFSMPAGLLDALSMKSIRRLMSDCLLFFDLLRSGESPPALDGLLDRIAPLGWPPLLKPESECMFGV